MLTLVNVLFLTQSKWVVKLTTVGILFLKSVMNEVKNLGHSKDYYMYFCVVKAGQGILKIIICILYC